jgi:hypothetical protein
MSSIATNKHDFSFDFSLDSLRFDEEENESSLHPFQHRVDFLSFKGYKAKINQEKRRAEFINRQKQARQVLTNSVRQNQLLPWVVFFDSSHLFIIFSFENFWIRCLTDKIRLDKS